MSVEQALTELRERTDVLLRGTPLTPGPQLTLATMDLVKLAISAAQAAAAVEAAASTDVEKTPLPGDEHFATVIHERWVTPHPDDRGEFAAFGNWATHDSIYSPWDMEGWVPEVPYWILAANWLTLRKLVHEREGVLLETWTAGADVVHLRTPGRLRIVDGSRELVREAGDLLCETPSNRRKQREGFKRADERISFCWPCANIADRVAPECNQQRLSHRVAEMTAPGWHWEGDDNPPA